MNGRFFVVLVLVAAVGLGAGAGAGAVQQRTKGNGANTSSLAAQQTRIVESTGGQSPSATPSGDQQSSFGTVESVTSSGFVLAGQGGRVQVATSSETKVQKMADARVSDLKVGDSIVATGEQQGDGTVAAASLQVGAMESARGMLGGMMGQLAQGAQRGQQRSGQQGSPPAGMQGGQALRGSVAMGTIEAISGDTITVKPQSGSSSKVKVSSSTVVRKMADGSLTDIRVGQTAVVSGGRKSDGTVTATSVQLIPVGDATSGR